MKKILFISDSYQDNGWDPFRESLITYLNSIDVSFMAIKANDYLQPNSAEPKSYLNLLKIKKNIKNFDPDIVFTVNRAGLSKDVMDSIPKTCKIITWFFDSYERLPAGLKLFRNKGEYVVIYGNNEHVNFFKKTYPIIKNLTSTCFGVDHFKFLPLNVKKENDIFFAGTLFDTSRFNQLISKIQKYSDVFEVFTDAFESHKEKYINNFSAYILKEIKSKNIPLDPELRAELKESETTQAIVDDQISSQNRILTLSALSKFNLKIFGSPVHLWINAMAQTYSNLLKVYQYRSTHSNSELISLYNKSKIAVNIMHHQAKDNGLPYRVFESMACKCLLLTHIGIKKPLEEVGFIENQHFVCFNGQEDVEKIARKYIENPKECKKIIDNAYELLISKYTLQKILSDVFEFSGETDIKNQILSLNKKDLVDTDNVKKIRTQPRKINIKTRWFGIEIQRMPSSKDVSEDLSFWGGMQNATNKIFLLLSGKMKKKSITISLIRYVLKIRLY